MKKFKLLSFSLIIILSLFFTYFTANAYDGQVRVYSELLEVSPGQSSELEIKIDENSNVSSFQFEWSYDSELINITDVTTTLDEIGTFDYNKANSVLVVSFYKAASKSLITEERVLFTIKFDVDNTAEFGDKISFIENVEQTEFSTIVESLPTQIESYEFDLANISVGKMGDVNLDGKIGVQDAISIQLYVVGKMTLNESQLKVGDINQDGKVTTRDAEFIIQFIAKKIDTLCFDVTKYTVSFYNYEDEKIKEIIVVEGEDVDVNDIPTPEIIEGKEFVKWSCELQDIKSNLEVKPIYKNQTYSVTFYDINGTVVKKVEVAAGSTVDKEDIPVLDDVVGKKFESWRYVTLSDGLDKKAYPYYSDVIEKYKVIYATDADKTVILSEQEYTVGVNYDISKAPKPAIIEGKEFSRWDEIKDSTTNDILLIPIYNDKYYNICFYNYDNEIFTSIMVKYGESVDTSNIVLPEIEGITFKSWNKDLTNIKNDIDVYPEFESNTQCTVEFYNSNQELIKTVFVNMGESVSKEDEPLVTSEIEDEVFKGWSEDIEHVLSNIKVYPIFGDYIEFTIYFYDYNYSIFTSIQIEQGKSLSQDEYPVLDSNEEYQFIEWDTIIEDVQNDQWVSPIYNRIEYYNINFYSQYNDYIKSIKIKSGESILEKDLPVIEINDGTFIKWNFDNTNITKDIDACPVYIPNDVDVTSIASIKNGEENQSYTFLGYCLATGEDVYIFSDGVDDIIVHSDDNDNKFRVGDYVIITGIYSRNGSIDEITLTDSRYANCSENFTPEYVEYSNNQMDTYYNGSEFDVIPVKFNGIVSSDGNSLSIFVGSSTIIKPDENNELNIKLYDGEEIEFEGYLYGAVTTTSSDKYIKMIITSIKRNSNNIIFGTWKSDNQMYIINKDQTVDYYENYQLVNTYELSKDEYDNYIIKLDEYGNTYTIDYSKDTYNYIYINNNWFDAYNYIPGKTENDIYFLGTFCNYEDGYGKEEYKVEIDLDGNYIINNFTSWQAFTCSFYNSYDSGSSISNFIHNEYQFEGGIYNFKLDNKTRELKYEIISTVYESNFMNVSVSELLTLNDVTSLKAGEVTENYYIITGKVTDFDYKSNQGKFMLVDKDDDTKSIIVWSTLNYGKIDEGYSLDLKDEVTLLCRVTNYEGTLELVKASIVREQYEYSNNAFYIVAFDDVSEITNGNYNDSKFLGEYIKTYSFEEHESFVPKIGQRLFISVFDKNTGDVKFYSLDENDENGYLVTNLISINTIEISETFDSNGKLVYIIDFDYNEFDVIYENKDEDENIIALELVFEVKPLNERTGELSDVLIKFNYYVNYVIVEEGLVNIENGEYSITLNNKTVIIELDNSNQQINMKSYTNLGPSKDDTINTILEINEIGSLLENEKETTEKYYVKGIISEIEDHKNGNIYIDDKNKNRLYIHGMYDILGNGFNNFNNGTPILGDEILIYGIVAKDNDVVEMKNVILYEINGYSIYDSTVDSQYLYNDYLNYDTVKGYTMIYNSEIADGLIDFYFNPNYVISDECKLSKLINYTDYKVMVNNVDILEKYIGKFTLVDDNNRNEIIQILSVAGLENSEDWIQYCYSICVEDPTIIELLKDVDCEYVFASEYYSLLLINDIQSDIETKIDIISCTNISMNETDDEIMIYRFATAEQAQVVYDFAINSDEESEYEIDEDEYRLVDDCLFIYQTQASMYEIFGGEYQTKTIDEINTLEPGNTYYKVSGVVESFGTDELANKRGYFYLADKTDTTKKIYVFGMNTGEKTFDFEEDVFLDMNIGIGDEITICGARIFYEPTNIYEFYGAFLVEIDKKYVFSEEDITAANNVENAISELGSLELTEEYYSGLQTIKTMYDALKSPQQSLVKNYYNLQNKMTAYNAYVTNETGLIQSINKLEINESIENNKTITGTIVYISEDSYISGYDTENDRASFYISDEEGNEIQIYRCHGVELSNIMVGKIITISGGSISNYEGRNQIRYAYYISLEDGKFETK